MYMTFSFSRYSYCRERGLGQLAYPLTESALLPAPGGLSPFNSDCYSVHTQSTQIHRLMISWFGKRPWASSDASSNFYPIHKAPDRHSEFKSLLEYLQQRGTHYSPRLPGSNLSLTFFSHLHSPVLGLCFSPLATLHRLPSTSSIA